MTDAQIHQFAQKIRDKFNPDRIILFGSRAYGVVGKDSDIDLLVVMRTEISVREQAYLIRRELDSAEPIDVIVRTPEQIVERIRLGDFFVKQIIEKGTAL